MIRFSTEQVIKLHKQLIDESGGEYGIRDNGLLESALNTPFQSFDNRDLYVTIQAKAARLGYGIIKNHPFIDGNKRSGVHIMLLYLYFNNIELEYSQDELSNFILKIASGEAEYKDLLNWIIQHQCNF